MTGRQADGAWHQVTPGEVLRKTGDSGTTYKLHHDGQELRVRVRTDRDQVEFWVKGAGWLVARVQANEDGTGIHVRPT